MIARLDDLSDADDDPATPEEVEDLLHDVRSFLNDPAALMERALFLLKAQREKASALIALGLVFGLDEWGPRAVHIGHVVADAIDLVT